MNTIKKNPESSGLLKLILADNRSINNFVLNCIVEIVQNVGTLLRYLYSFAELLLCCRILKIYEGNLNWNYHEKCKLGERFHQQSLFEFDRRR